MIQPEPGKIRTNGIHKVANRESQKTNVLTASVATYSFSNTVFQTIAATIAPTTGATIKSQR
jgi:hypothetical protein